MSWTLRYRNAHDRDIVFKDFTVQERQTDMDNISISTYRYTWRWSPRKKVVISSWGESRGTQKMENGKAELGPEI